MQPARLGAGLTALVPVMASWGGRLRIRIPTVQSRSAEFCCCREKREDASGTEHSVRVEA